jgi:RNA polymerase sigma factor (sigma-70 family)
MAPATSETCGCERDQLESIVRTDGANGVPGHETCRKAARSSGFVRLVAVVASTQAMNRRARLSGSLRDVPLAELVNEVVQRWTGPWHRRPLPPFEPAEEPLAWLIAQARAEADLYLRRRRRQDRRARSGCPERLRVVPEQGSDANAQARELRADVLEVLARLGPNDQQVLTLFFRDGLTKPQIGTRLGLSRHQVHRRLTQAKSRLLRLIQERFPGLIPDGWAVSAQDVQRSAGRTE